VSTDLFYGIITGNGMANYFRSCLTRLLNLPIRNRVRVYNDPDSYWDSFKTKELLYVCPNMASLSLDLRGDLNVLLKQAPHLEELRLVNPHWDSDDDSDSEDEDDDMHDFHFPELPNLKRLRFVHRTRPYNVPIPEIFATYPSLQELRIPDIEYRNCEFIRGNIPKHLKVLECPLWWFLLVWTQPGTVIDRLRPVAGKTWREDCDNVLEQYGVTKKQGHSVPALDENMSNITVNVLEADECLVKSGLCGILFRGNSKWHTLEMDVVRVTACYALTQLAVYPCNNYVRRFTTVRIRMGGDCSNVVHEVACHVVESFWSDLVDIWTTVRLQIDCIGSTRGIATVVCLPEHKMCEVIWGVCPEMHLDRWKQ